MRLNAEKEIHPTMLRLYKFVLDEVNISESEKRNIQTFVANALGKTPQTVNNWESRGISHQGASDAQTILGCDAQFIKHGEKKKKIPLVKNPERKIPDHVQKSLSREKTYRTIKNYKEVSGSMGNGVLLQGQNGEILEIIVSDDWVRNNIPNNTGKDNLCIVTGFGDSMKGMFNNGDPLIIDTGVQDLTFDAVYFFRVGNEGFIKRLQRVPGIGIRAISKNPEYETWTITEDMDFEIFGRVIKVWESSNF